MQIIINESGNIVEGYNVHTVYNEGVLSIKF